MSRFRKEYRELSDEEKEIINDIKTGAEMLEEVINKIPASREKSIAITKLEETVMWAVKGITG